MSLSTQTLRRLPTIKEKLLKNWTIGQIADVLGVTEKTIDRDLKAFVDSGQFETWLKQEWIRLHAKVLDEAPIEAYRQVSRLLGRMVTRKAELKTVEEIREIKVNWNVNTGTPNKLHPTP